MINADYLEGSCQITSRLSLIRTVESQAPDLETFMCKVLSLQLTIFFVFRFSFLFHVYSCLSECISAYSAQEGQKRALAPLGLENQNVRVLSLSSPGEW